jgi:hypothetical protein
MAAITFTAPPPSITTWNRLEPRPKTNIVGPSIAAEVRDPAWFLARQWQVGELTGQDAGSPAFVSVTTTTGAITGVKIGATTTPLLPGVPLERQALAEPFSPDDLLLQVEIGQVLADMLDGLFGAGSEPALRLRAAFAAGFPVKTPTLDFFNPIDAAAARFLVVCAGKAVNGSGVYVRMKSLPTGTTTLPSDLALGSAAENAQLFTLLGNLVKWVELVWSAVGPADPAGWVPNRLDYAVSVQATTPGGGAATMSLVPDATGEIQWSSFDVTASTTGAGSPAKTVAFVPNTVRFPGQPSQRFWDFESSDIALPDIQPDPRDVTKLLVVDFMLVHGPDWFLVPLTQAVGDLTRVDALVVTDVFGRVTAIDRADLGHTAPGPTRWTAFTNTANVSPPGLGDFLILPPSVGTLVQSSRVVEEVRFARDEMANMAWAIERRTPNLMGGARTGSQRDALIEAIAPVTPPASTDTTSPLRYVVESRVPVQYVPLVGVQPSTSSPAFVLELAADVRPDDHGVLTPVAPASKILQPTPPQAPYQIIEEQVPRLGTTVERAVYRARWIDGSTHLWIARRRRSGAGEAQSGLRFDAALATNAEGT